MNQQHPSIYSNQINNASSSSSTTTSSPSSSAISLSNNNINNNNNNTILTMPDIEHVYSVIRAMYEQAEFKESAAKWLEELQRSIFAWKLSHELLSKKIDFNSCYFAAQTLKTKILQSFFELPVESYDDLKESIIIHLNNMNEKAIQTQLCLSLTYIFFMNENWETPIEELSNKLPKGTLLEILICIGQEYDETRPTFKLTKKRRDQIQDYLSKRFNDVIHLVMSCLQDSIGCELSVQDQICRKCLSCFEVWINFAQKEHLNLVESMLDIVYGYLKTPNCPSGTHEGASDVLCRVIYQCEARSKFSDIRPKVIEQVYSLESAYQNALAVEDSTKLMDLARIFVELGNSTIDFIIYDQIDTKIIEMILNCVSHYEFEVAEVTFGFWYNFSEILKKHNHFKYAPYYNMLLSSLTRHCQVESDHDGIVEEKSDVYDYRSQISDLIQEISMCIDWVNYLKSINVIEIFKPTTPWEIIESHLFILLCIACEAETFNSNPNRNDVLPGIVNYILTLPISNSNCNNNNNNANNNSINNINNNIINVNPNSNQIHVQVYATSCDLLGEFCKWINENSNFIQPVVTFLLNVITSNHASCTKLSTKAAQALKQILSSMNTIFYSEWLANLFIDLINIYSSIEDRVDLGIPILACCTAILSNESVEQCDEQELFFQQLIQLCLNKINNVLSMKFCSVEERKKKWEKIIDNIYAVFKNFRPNEKTKNSTVIHTYIRENIWPFLKESMTYFAPIDSQVIEHCVRCVRHIVRSMKPSYLLQPIVDHIVPLFQLYPTNSSLLYIGSVLVDEFGDKNDPITSDGIIRMLNAFSITTFNFLNKQNSTNSINPDMLDDYFNLCTRVMTKLTEKFMLNTETMNEILNLTLTAIYIPQKESCDSILKFLLEFLTINHPIQLQYIENNYGRNLFYALIDAIVFKLPGYFIPDMVETIWMFKVNFDQQYKQYLEYTTHNLYQKAQRDGYHVSQEDFKSFYETLKSADKPKIFVSELRHLQRLFS